MATVQEYADFGPHCTGSFAEQQTAQWLMEQLKAAGFLVESQDVPFDYFAPHSAFIEAGGLQVSVMPVWPPVWTLQTGRNGPLQPYRPDWDELEKGAIAWVDLPYRRHNSIHELGIDKLLEKVAAAGAAAVVAVTHGPTGETVALNSKSGAFFSRIPIVLIGPRDARALATHRGRKTHATLTLTGSGPERRTAQNVIGKVERGGNWVIVSTPFSSWHTSAAERGSGIAIFVALARWLPQVFPRQSFLFVATTGHELGHLGANVFLQHAAPPPEESRLWLHLGAGLAARDYQEYGPMLLPLQTADAQRFLVGNGDTVTLLRQSFQGVTGLEQVYSGDSKSTSGEYSAILSAGYVPAIGAFGSHRFHHTTADTVDKTDGRLIAPVAEGFRRVLEEMLAEPSESQHP